MNNIRSTLAAVWRIAIPYFTSNDKFAGRGLLAAVIALELGYVAITVMVNRWNSDFYNALQERDLPAFTYQLGYFAVLATASVIVQVYQIYLNQWLRIRWRRWMTEHYLAAWLSDANHYRMQLQGESADNPDQRIEEDVQLFVDQTLSLSIGLLSAVVTIGSFVVILWGLSAAAPLHVFGTDLNIPGYLIWAALIYAIAGTVLTHLIGWPLVGLNFRQQRFEADFRFDLVRVRENGEQIALLKGEPAERQRLSQRFGLVVRNYLDLMTRTKKLTALTSSYNQAAVLFPYIMVAPAYFANKVQLGSMMQTASAFSSVQESMSYFVTAYRTLAEWQAVVARLEGFERAITAGKDLASNAGIIHATPGAGTAISLRDLTVTLPSGARLVDAPDTQLRQGERTLLTGPSGSGKSTLFRAIAGIWPFGKGNVTLPSNASVMMLPQRPYFPVGSLKQAIVYPSAANAFETATVADAVAAVGLPALASRLDEDAHWNRLLSLGEQQRLGVARALLHRPDYLFLDEATASLDEASESALYRLIAERLPATTVVSIGHRNTLLALHDRKIALTRSGDRFALAEAEARHV